MYSATKWWLQVDPVLRYQNWYYDWKFLAPFFPFGLDVDAWRDGSFHSQSKSSSASVTWLPFLDSALTDGHLNTWLYMQSLCPSTIFLKLSPNSFFSYISSKSSTVLCYLWEIVHVMCLYVKYLLSFWKKKSFCSMTKWKVFNLKVILLISSHPH